MSKDVYYTLVCNKNEEQPICLSAQEQENKLLYKYNEIVYHS